MEDMKAVSLYELIALFSSHNESAALKDGPVRVYIPARFEKKDDDNPSRKGLIPFKALAYHDKKNCNQSYIDPDVFVKKTPSAQLRPVLAHVIEKDGTKDFGAHDYQINSDGTVTYLEDIVGVISDRICFEKDSVQDVNRALVEGFLFADYRPDVIEVLASKDNSIDVSIELDVSACHWNKEDGYLSLDDYYVQGLTMLGTGHAPGMKGSKLNLMDFELSPGLIEGIEKAGAFIAENENQEEKGEESMENEKEEVVETEAAETEVEETEETVEEAVKEETVEETAEDTVPEEEKFEFSVSLEDLAARIAKAVMKKYEELTHCWDCSYIGTFNDYAVVKDWSKDCYARCLYSVQDNKVTIGETFEECEIEFVPSVKEFEAKMSELNEKLETLKTDYDKVNEELSQYKFKEEKEAKLAILNDEKYSAYANRAEFRALFESLDGFSVEEISVQAKLAYADIKLEQETKAEKKMNTTAAKKLFTGENKEILDSMSEKYGTILKKRKK